MVCSCWLTPHLQIINRLGPRSKAPPSRQGGRPPWGCCRAIFRRLDSDQQECSRHHVSDVFSLFRCFHHHYDDDDDDYPAVLRLYDAFARSFVGPSVCMSQSRNGLLTRKQKDMKQNWRERSQGLSTVTDVTIFSSKVER